MTATSEREILTYSALNCWRNCPRKYKLRYQEHLRPREKAETLAFGSTIHGALELWHGSADDPNRLMKVFDFLDTEYASRDADPDAKAAWFQARAMMAGYAARYPQEEFTVLELEKEFQGEIRNPDADPDAKAAWFQARAMMAAYAARYPQEEFTVLELEKEFQGEIRNPATGGASKTFTMAGKVDGIVQLGNELYLLEHKTASSIDGAYLDRLWCDTQIALYTHYLREMGYPVVGVIYNVLLKTRLKQRQGETEEEYLERKAALAAKSKSGKSTAKRQEPETDADFMGRLADWYSKPESFHREKIYLSEDRIAMVAEEIWEITQQYLGARSRDSWLLNTSYCFNWSRPCEYLPYCQSGFNPILRDNLFDVVPPHEELAGSDSLSF